MALKGKLTPEQQLQIMGRIWGYDRKGSVFLPYIDGWCKDKEERKKNFHEGRAFQWPRDKDAIRAHLEAHAQDDVYFAPNLFDGKRRIEQNVAPEKALYADLDAVSPEGLGPLRPTIAWESSPGHYQGIWLLNSERTGATWPGKENHRLTTAIEADQSGWDATQLLRVPGRPNFKPEYKAKNNGKPVMAGGLLWHDGPRYVWSDFDDLPEVGAVVTGEDVELIDEQAIDAVDRHEVWARVRLKVSHKCREYLAFKGDPTGDRDQVLWQIERDLADAGCSLIEIVAIVRPSVWNKYRGRNDEMKRLKIEAAKAIAAREETALEEVETPKPNINWLADVVLQPIPRPKWLVRDIWTRGGCGFIAGAPKSYKSWTALDMAIAVATGTNFLNQQQFRVKQPEPVLYLQEEDSLALVMDRLANILESKAPDRLWTGQMHIVGDDACPPLPLSVRHSVHSGDVVWMPPTQSTPLALHVQTGFVASDPGWQAWLDDTIEEGKFSLVVIDTLGTTVGDVDTDKTGPLMNQVLKPLKQLANKHDTAICIVHHNRKAAADGGGRAGNDMLGAVGLHAWVDCAIYARSKNLKGEVAIEREAKLAQDMSLKVRIPTMFWDHSGDRHLWDPEIVTEGLETEQAPVEEAHQERKREGGKAGQHIAGRIKGMGPTKVHTLPDLVTTLGKSQSEIVKQLNAAVDNGFLEEVGDGWRFVRS